MGVVKGRGIPKGGKIQKLHPFRITKKDREQLFQINLRTGDCAKEGFPQMTNDQFIDLYCKHNGGDEHQTITRIEFEHL